MPRQGNLTKFNDRKLRREADRDSSRCCSPAYTILKPPHLGLDLPLWNGRIS